MWHVTLMRLIWAFPKIKTDNIIVIFVYQIYSRKIVALIVNLAIASQFSLMKVARARRQNIILMVLVEYIKY